MNKKFKNQSGITLIALIITIIILVILAAVSIRAVYNMGIVGHAINGTQDYAKAAKDEEEDMGKTGNVIEDAVAKVKEIQGDGGVGEGTVTTPVTKTYTIATTVNNGTHTGATSITQNGTATVTISANTDYTLPSTVTVTGATHSYNNITGEVTLSEPTGNVTITAICTEVVVSARGIVKLASNATTTGTTTTFTEGQEVKIGDESFFVLSDENGTLKLLAKYCLSTTENMQTDKHGAVAGASFVNFGRSFSSENYWNGKDGTNSTCDLQTEERLAWMTETETEVNNAIKKAQAYGTAIAQIAGITDTGKVKGMLMKYEEAKAIKDASTENKTEAEVAQIQKMKRILWGRWNESDASDPPISTAVDWWLGSSSSLTNNVWYIDSTSCKVYYRSYDRSCGVRPVLEIT